jgi:spectrin beta
VKEVRNDEDSVQIYLKKITDIIAEMETSWDAKVAALDAHSRAMVDRGHFDSANITERMGDLNARYTDFQAAILEQRRSRVDQMAVIEFFHEVEDTTEWINSQMVTAASEDYGKDVGHVEMLIKSFDSFMSTVAASEERMTRVIALSEKLLSEENRHADIIAAKVAELSQLWEDLKELAGARHEALNGAKQVHVFDKNADETIAWIAEKEAAMSTDELGQDLETIQSLLERQQGLQRDLAAIQEQVVAVEKEAAVLSELFPDAAAHIGSKREETRLALSTLLAMSAARDERLRQNQLIQRYFDDYRELMAWSSEVLAKMTSPDLAADLTGELHFPMIIGIDFRRIIIWIQIGLGLSQY